MKIRKPSTTRFVEFDDIQYGDVLTFPDTPWKDMVLMRYWHIEEHGKLNEQLEQIHLVRLDSKDAGETFTPTRKMMTEVTPYRKTLYRPVRHPNTTISLEEQS